MPPLFVVKKASNSLSMVCGRGPRRHRGRSRAHGRSSSRPVLISNRRGRSSTSAIASEALRSRFRMTCCSWIAIAGDRREVVGELRLKDDAVSLQVVDDSATTSCVASFRSSVSSVNSLLPKSARNRAITSDGAVAIANRPPRGFARAVDVRRIGVQHPQARAGVGDDARERLIDLMRDRGGQGAQGRDSRRHGRARSGPCSGPPRRRSVSVTSWRAPMNSGRPATCSMT